METVYAIHNFDAENDDEIAFQVGEAITVLQKDEMYGDGWWEGQNTRGEIGLFPMNYTSPTKPDLLSTPIFDINTRANRSASPKPVTSSTPPPSFNSGSSVRPTSPSSIRKQPSPSPTTLEFKLDSAITQISTPSSPPSLYSGPLSTGPLSTGSPATPKLKQSSSGSTKPGTKKKARKRTPSEQGGDFLSSSGVPKTKKRDPSPGGSATKPRPVVGPAPGPPSAGHPLTSVMEAGPAVERANLQEWSIQDVAGWLKSVGLEAVVENFINQEITGDILLELNIETLKELDIPTFGKRFKIMSAINSLKEEAGLLPKEDGENKLSNIISNSAAAASTTSLTSHSQQRNPLAPRPSLDSARPYERPRYNSSGATPNSTNPGPKRINSLQQFTKPMTPQELYNFHEVGPPRPAPAPPIKPAPASRSNGLYESPRKAPLPPSGSDASTPGSPRARQLVPPAQTPNLSRSSTNSSSHSNSTTGSGSQPRSPVQTMAGIVIYPPDRNGIASRANGLAGPAPLASHSSIVTGSNGLHRTGTWQSVQSVGSMGSAGSTGSWGSSVELIRSTPGNGQRNASGGDGYIMSMNADFRRPSNDATSRDSDFDGIVRRSTSTPITRTDSSPVRGSFDQISRPDHEGWLHKQGDKYKTWNKRWFVLKGSNLFYFKTAANVKMKGHINLRGYRIIHDENIYTGKYCFKAYHERERTFFFYTDTEMHMKGWITAMMKATIYRDISAPVLSSCNIPTVSLEVAQQAHPRPPSVIAKPKKQQPTSPSLAPPATIPLTSLALDSDSQTHEANAISSHVTMDARPSSRLSNHSARSLDPYDNGSQRDNGSLRENGSIRSVSSANSPVDKSPNFRHNYNGSTTSNTSGLLSSTSMPGEDEDDDVIDPQGFFGGRPGGLKRLTEVTEESERNSRIASPGLGLVTNGANNVHGVNGVNGVNGIKNVAATPLKIPTIFAPGTKLTPTQYVEWVNDRLPAGVAPISDLVNGLKSGEVLIKLLEGLSGKDVRRPPQPEDGSPSMAMLDNIVAAFKFMGREEVVVNGDFTIKDVFGGNEPKIVELLDAVRTWADERGYGPVVEAPVNTHLSVIGSTVAETEDDYEEDEMAILERGSESSFGGAADLEQIGRLAGKLTSFEAMG